MDPTEQVGRRETAQTLGQPEGEADAAFTKSGLRCGQDSPAPAVHPAERPCKGGLRPPRSGVRQGLSWELSAIAGPGGSLVDKRLPWCRRKTSWAAVASFREPRAPFPPGAQPSLWFCSKALPRVQGAACSNSQLSSIHPCLLVQPLGSQRPWKTLGGWCLFGQLVAAAPRSGQLPAAGSRPHIT